MRKFLILLATVAISAPLYAASTDVDFDKGTGLNVSAYIEENASKIATPRPSGPMSSRYTVGCTTFKLSPSNSSITTNQVRIQSQEFVNECHYMPDPIPPSHHIQPNMPKPGNTGHVSPRPTNGNNGNVSPRPTNGNNNSHNVHQPGAMPHQPSHSSHASHGSASPRPGHKSISATEEVADTRSGDSRQMVCNERPGRTFTHNVRLNVGRRNLYPWETEEITVCAEHEHTWISESKTPYVYDISERTQTGGGVNSTKTFTLNPVSRNPSAPDEEGMTATAFRYSNGRFYLNVADKWANYYDGEKVIIRVALYRDRFLVDKKLGEKEFELHVDRNYALEFSEGDFDDDKDYEPEYETRGDRGQTKYYVKWGFQRIGYVSTDKYIKKGSTNKISVNN